MKKQLLNALIAVILLLIPNVNFGQTPDNGMISLNTGVALDGRVLTTTGALITNSINAVASVVPFNYTPLSVPSPDAANANETVTIYPNPFNTSATIRINGASQIKKIELRIYNILGKEVIKTTPTKQLTTLETRNLPSGMYFYKVMDNDKTIQSGKLFSQQ